MSSYVKIIALVGLIGVSFSCGYKWRDYQIVQERLHQEEIDKEANKAFLKGQTELLDKMNQSLKEFDRGNKVNEKTIIKEKTKTVFRNVCVSDDYVRMFNETSESGKSQLPSETKR